MLNILDVNFKVEMKRPTLTMLLLFSVLCCLVYDAHGSIIRFDSTPVSLTNSLTPTLTLHCALNDSAASGGIIGRRDVTETSDNVIEVTSLIIMKDGIDVASISHTLPAYIMNGSSNAKASGTLSGSGGYLQIDINRPANTEAGEFTCEVNALSHSGHNVVFSTSIEIGMVEPSTADMLAYIRDMRLELDDNQKQIHDLKQGVFFSTALSHDASVPDDQSVVYDIVYSNVGGGYSAKTGEFVCPKSGYYEFEISALGMPDKNYWLNLEHNDATIVSIHGAKSDFQGTTNSAIFHVKEKDIVRVVALGDWGANVLHGWAPTQIYTTFVGKLVAAP